MKLVWDITVLSGFKTQANKWIRRHDNIFFYSKSQNKVFNKLKVPHKKNILTALIKKIKTGGYILMVEVRLYTLMM